MPWVFQVCTLVLLGTAVLSSKPAAAQSPSETAAARAILSELQFDSFDNNREYCGTIAINDDGAYIYSRVRRGRKDSCRPPNAWGGEVIASFHTHAGFDFDADSEVPSPADVYSDFDEGINGYVATPGGRFWFIDGQNLTVSMICGIGCLPQDPDFQPGVFGEIRSFYTIDDLEWRLQGF